jgi:hypothetical protein
MSAGYTNQRIAHIHKGQMMSGNFSSITNFDVEQAYTDLTFCEHKLWHYLAKNNNDHDWNVSSKYLREHYALDRKSYWRAYKGLIDKGYIVEISDVEFNFYAHPSYNPDYVDEI